MYITYKVGIDSSNKAVENAVEDLFNGDINVTIPDTTNTQSYLITRTKKVDTLKSTETVFPTPRLFVVDRILKEKLATHNDIESEYTTFKIPKKTHGFRTIEAPMPKLKTDQRDVANMLTYYLGMLAHNSAWAYVRNRDVVRAMQQHADNESRWYLKLDLHDFFGSCSSEFIKQQLKKLYPLALQVNVTDEIIDSIVKLATKDNKLPQGTPLSPVLTNLIMVEFDYKINRLLYEATKQDGLLAQNYIYTRYADDIIISARNKFDYTIIVNKIKELLEPTPLRLNEEKTRFGSSSGRNWNLGVMCNKDNNLTVGYRTKQKLKCTIHNYMSCRNTENAWELSDLYWLQGELSWLRNVEPNYFGAFKKYLFNKYGVDVPASIIADIKHH